MFLSRASWGSHQRCWHRRAKGNAFEKSHPPPIKKNTTKHQKAPPTTTKPHLLHFSFMRARNTTKLRGRQGTAAVSFHAQIKPLLGSCSPTVSALLAGGTPGNIQPSREPAPAPQETFTQWCGWQGFSPQLCPDLSEPRAVSRPVKSLLPRGCSELPP